MILFSIYLVKGPIDRVSTKLFDFLGNNTQLFRLGFTMPAKSFGMDGRGLKSPPPV